MITRTPTIDADTDFEVSVPITKSWVSSKTGERHLVGVATGIAEDRDGERCSVDCVKGMGKAIQKGGVKVTAAHQQDWMTEIGDVRKADFNPDTDELSITAVLPPEGADPIADKAWKVANSEKVGWSIGGKLLSHFYERNEVGKKRKVLDSILLKHVALTKNPAYAASFAEAVSKTFTGDEPADDDFTLEAEVEKDMTTGSWVNGGSDGGGGNVGRDSVGSGKRNAGSNKKGAPLKTEDTSDDDSDSDGDDGKDLPKAKSERHLACPNCGHEFAADLPVDPEDQQLDETSDNEDDDESQGDAGKSATKENDLMATVKETLDALKALVEQNEVAKTADPEPTADEAGVSEVEKMVAASHQHTEARLDTIEKSTGEGFELIAKSLKELQEQVASLPLGRRSTAVRTPTTGHDADGVEKTTEQLVEEAPDAASALKVMNEAAGWTAR